MLIDKVGDIVDLSIEYDPAAFRTAMLLDYTYNISSFKFWKLYLKSFLTLVKCEGSGHCGRVDQAIGLANL